jgi:hypothetical protein
MTPAPKESTNEMANMYDDQPAPEASTSEKDAGLASKAALWTEAAQQQYAHLTSLPDSAQAQSRMQIGYLQQAKQAAEELSRKAN